MEKEGRLSHILMLRNRVRYAEVSFTPKAITPPLPGLFTIKCIINFKHYSTNSATSGAPNLNLASGCTFCANHVTDAYGVGISFFVHPVFCSQFYPEKHFVLSGHLLLDRVKSSSRLKH
jgi:hypothetical protein